MVNHIYYRISQEVAYLLIRYIVPCHLEEGRGSPYPLLEDPKTIYTVITNLPEYRILRELAKDLSLEQINEVLVHAYFFTYHNSNTYSNSRAYLAEVINITEEHVEVRDVLTKEHHIVYNPYNFILKKGKKIVVHHTHIVDANPPTYILKLHHTKNFEEWKYIILGHPSSFKNDDSLHERV